MKWMIQYSKMPTAHNPVRKALVEAETAEAAALALRHMLGESRGSSRYVIQAPVEYDDNALSDAQVLTLDMGEGR